MFRIFKNKKSIINELRDDLSKKNKQILDLEKELFNTNQRTDELLFDKEKLFNSRIKSFQYKVDEANELFNAHVESINRMKKKDAIEGEAKRKLMESEIKQSLRKEMESEVKEMEKSLEKRYGDSILELQNEIEFLKSENEELRDEIESNNSEYYDALGKYDGALTVITSKDKEIERLNAIIKLGFNSLPTVSATIKTA